MIRLFQKDDLQWYADKKFLKLDTNEVFRLVRHDDPLWKNPRFSLQSEDADMSPIKRAAMCEYLNRNHFVLYSERFSSGDPTLYLEKLEKAIHRQYQKRGFHLPTDVPQRVWVSTPDQRVNFNCRCSTKPVTLDDIKIDVKPEHVDKALSEIIRSIHPAEPVSAPVSPNWDEAPEAATHWMAPTLAFAACWIAHGVKDTGREHIDTWHRFYNGVWHSVAETYIIRQKLIARPPVEPLTFIKPGKVVSVDPVRDEFGNPLGVSVGFQGELSKEQAGTSFDLASGLDKTVAVEFNGEGEVISVNDIDPENRTYAQEEASKTPPDAFPKFDHSLIFPVDFENAPEGTTHAMDATADHSACWLKKTNTSGSPLGDWFKYFRGTWYEFNSAFIDASKIWSSLDYEEALSPAKDEDQRGELPEEPNRFELD